MKKEDKKMLFEMMEKINPSFKLNEANMQQTPVAPQQQTAQPAQPTDVKALSKATQTASSVKSASQRINTTTEFPEAFKAWFSGLGYKPENPAISIARVKTEVEKALKQMGYR